MGLRDQHIQSSWTLWPKLESRLLLMFFLFVIHFLKDTGLFDFVPYAIWPDVGWNLINDGECSAQQKDDRKILKRWQWSCVLMDEAHALKDKSSYRWKNLMSVAKNANQRLMLTGTPLQNDLHVLLAKTSCLELLKFSIVLNAN